MAELTLSVRNGGLWLVCRDSDQVANPQRVSVRVLAEGQEPMPLDELLDHLWKRGRQLQSIADALRGMPIQVPEAVEVPERSRPAED